MNSGRSSQNMTARSSNNTSFSPTSGLFYFITFCGYNCFSQSNLSSSNVAFCSCFSVSGGNTNIESNYTSSSSFYPITSTMNEGLRQTAFATSISSDLAARAVITFDIGVPPETEKQEQKATFDKSARRARRWSGRSSTACSPARMRIRALCCRSEALRITPSSTSITK